MGSQMSDMTEYAHTEKDDIHKRLSTLLKSLFLNSFFNGRKLPYIVVLSFAINNMNQPQLCMCPLPLEPPSSSQSHPSRSSQSPRLGSLFYTAISHQLSI